MATDSNSLLQCIDAFEDNLHTLELDLVNRQCLEILHRQILEIIKEAQSLHYQGVEKLAMAGESTIALLNNQQLKLDDVITLTIFSMVEAMRDCVQEVETKGRESSKFFYQNILDLFQRINACSSRAKLRERTEIRHPKLTQEIKTQALSALDSRKDMQKKSGTLVEPVNAVPGKMHSFDSDAVSFAKEREAERRQSEEIRMYCESIGRQ